MTHHWITCAAESCKTQFAMAEDIYRVANQRKERQSFWCPNRHSQHFVTGRSALEVANERADGLERRLQRQIQNGAYLEDQVKAARHQTAAFKGMVTKIKKRVGNGVCPCCNRTFENLARHMKAKHSDYQESK